MTHDPFPSGPPWAPTPVPAPAPAKRRRGLYAAVAVAVVLVGGTAALTVLLNRDDDPRAADEPSTVFADAVSACTNIRSGVQVSDGGRTLIVDSAGEEDTSGASISTLACLLSELDIPTAVVEQMDTTRALDGRQEADWGQFHASWTYHPDDGLDLIVTLS